MSTSFQAGSVTYPLKISANGRYFIDQQDHPFLYHADTGWLLFSKLTQAEAVVYLQNRQQKKFTAIQVMLLPEEPEHTNRDGDGPFTTPGDLTMPHHAYFAHVDAVIRQAAARGLLVAIQPVWIGCCGGNWADTLRANGPAAARAYGRYLGQHYRDIPNVVWLLGGDNDPHDLVEVERELALGIKEDAPHQLITYHAASTHSSSDIFPDEPWLDWSMTYTYFRGKQRIWVPADQVPEVYAVNYAEHNKVPVKPFVLGEAQYEGETAEGTAGRVRKQAWWSMLSGAAGHAYGSPLYSFPDNWRDCLDLPGTAALTHLYDVLSSRAWYGLVPDQEHTVVTDGYGTFGAADYVTTARTDDGSLVMAYIPPTKAGSRTLTVDLGKLNGNVTATWVDPTNGSYVAVAESPLNNSGSHAFTAPTTNSAGDHDWVLVLETTSNDAA
jgi:hypothetical protein